MKYKKRLAKLQSRRDYWDKQDKAYQASCKRPGSQSK